jgi:hypothetical protein
MMTGITTPYAQRQGPSRRAIRGGLTLVKRSNQSRHGAQAPHGRGNSIGIANDSMIEHSHYDSFRLAEKRGLALFCAACRCAALAA